MPSFCTTSRTVQYFQFFSWQGRRAAASARTAQRAIPLPFDPSQPIVLVRPCDFALLLFAVSNILASEPFMNFIVCLVIGAVLGALGGAGIYFEPEEPYKWQILLAATLKGALVGLLTGFSLAPDSRWWAGLATGAAYGCASGLVIYLAKGGPKSGDAPYVIPSTIVTGALTGLFIIFWGFKA